MAGDVKVDRARKREDTYIAKLIESDDAKRRREKQDFDGAIGLPGPGFPQRSQFVLIGMRGSAATHDDDLHVRLQLVDVAGRRGVDTVSAIGNSLVRMGLAYFLGHAVDKIPDVVGQGTTIAKLG